MSKDSKGFYLEQLEVHFQLFINFLSIGKVLAYFDDNEVILKDFNGNPINKVIYVLVFQEGHHFRDKVVKICDSFLGKRYKLPNNGHADKSTFSRKVRKIDKKIEETKNILKITKE